jgi:hypothetical protein
MRADQRPWVYINSPEVGGPAIVDESGYHFTIKFGFRSAGKEPAAKVSVYLDTSIVELDHRLSGKGEKGVSQVVEAFCKSKAPTKSAIHCLPTVHMPRAINKASRGKR